MKKIKFRENGEEHNFWQNYTDLMSGFLIVFIIASLVAYNKYKGYVELYYGVGVTEANINDIVVNAKLYKKLRINSRANTLHTIQNTIDLNVL